MDAKALAVYHVAEGDGDGSKIPSNLPACLILSKCRELEDIAHSNSSLYYIPNIPQKGLRNPRILEFREINIYS